MALIDNLVSWWTLDETSGTRVDSHTNGNDLTDNNTVLSGTGKISNGADFEDSNSEYLNIATGSQTGLELTGDFSISAWVKMESTPSGTTYIIGGTSAGSGGGYSFQIDQSVHVQVEYWSGAGTANLTRKYWNSALSSGTWYHLVCTADVSAKAIKIYVDNSDKTLTVPWNNATSVADNNQGFALGAFPAGTAGTFFDGIVDEVGVWDRVLTSTEVSELYNSGSGITYTDFATTDYPITASVGTFTLTGIASALQIGRNLATVVGAFTLTGINTILSFGRMMAVTVGTFTLTGIDVILLFGKRLIASVGTFTLTGIDAVVTSARTMVASTASFVLTGIASILSVGHTIVASVGSFTLTGIDAVLAYGRGIVASVGSFTLSGIAVAFPRASKVVAGTGSFIMTGINALFTVTGWRNPFTKNSISPTNTSKNDESWINQSKS